MNKIIRYFNQNRKRIILWIVIVASVFLLLRILNAMAIASKNNKQNTIENVGINKLPTQSIITKEKVDIDTTKSNVDIINEFVEFCNSGNYDKAYEMLSKDCKELAYSSKEEFIKDYGNLIFKSKKMCEIENFRNSSNTYTYQVTFYEDILSTGKLEGTQKHTDYITIVEENKNKKINISSFIFKEQIDKQTQQDGITINVNSKEVHKEYEIYNVKITNDTQKTILVDTQQKSVSTFGIGSDNANYRAFMYEIPINLLEIQPNTTRTYRIRLNKIYNPSVRIKAIKFTDIIADYEEYKNTKEKTEDRMEIKVVF